MSTTASGLARTFGIVIRQISDLLSVLSDYPRLGPTLARTLDIGYAESQSLQALIQRLTKPNWDWLMTVLDSTEAQLRFGSALTGVTDPAAHASQLRQQQVAQAQAAQQQQQPRTGYERLAARHTIAQMTGERPGGPTSDPVSNANRRDFLQVRQLFCLLVQMTTMLCPFL